MKRKRRAKRKYIKQYGGVFKGINRQRGRKNNKTQKGGILQWLLMKKMLSG